MTRTLTVLLVATPTLAQAPHLVLERPSGGGLVVAALDWGQLRGCFTPPPEVAPEAVVAAVQRPEGWVALPTQYDSMGGTAGEVAVSLDGAPDGPLVLFFTAEAPVRPPTPAGGVEVGRVGDGLRVATRYYQVTHDPARLGGLPSRVELLPSGKVFEGFALNDRLYQRERGQFWLRGDTAPTVELLAAGPLRAVVRVSARYLAEGQPTASAARAVYLFSYAAGSPLVQVTATVTQDAPLEWPELHFLEIHFADTSFPGWLGPDGEQPFAADSSTATPAWAALADGDSLIGLFGRGVVRVHDGRGQYGTYLHGPWEQWSSRRHEFAMTLFLSGAPDSRQSLRQAATGPARTPRVGALPAPTAALLEAFEPKPERPLAGWYAALLRGLIADGRLTDAHRIATALALRSQSDDLNLTWLQQQTGLQLLVSPRLAVAVRHPYLLSLYDVDAQRELLAGPMPLWQAQLRTADRRLIDYGPADMAPPPVPRERGTTAVWEAQASVSVDGQAVPGPVVRTTLSLDGPKLAIHLGIRNDSPLAVWRVQTPLRLGPLGDDARVFYPLRCGVDVPVRNGVGYRSMYPSGGAVMQYYALYDGVSGVYVAMEDPTAATKDLIVEGPDDRGRVLLGCDWPLPDMNRPGNDWEQPGETVLEVFRGDWFDAAQRYQRWVTAAAPWWLERGSRRTPEWMPEIAVWGLPNGHAYEPDNAVARVKRFAEYMGAPTAVHWYNWHQIPFDDQYPHYNPTKPRMAEGVRELQAAGVRVMPYINGRLWDSRLEDFKQEAYRYACWDEDGQPYTEQYGSGVPLAPMDPTTPFWQDQVREIVLWLHNDIGVDGVYIDQIGAAAPRLSFNPGPGHPLGGGSWWTVDGYWPLLGRLREAMAPDKFITTEDNAECYLHRLDGMLAWAWQSDSMVPAFPAVYAGEVAMFGRAGGGDVTALRMKVAQSLVFGEQLGWWDPGVIDQPIGPFLRDAARLRARLTPYLARGTMLRPPALEGEVPPVTGDFAFYGRHIVTFPVLQVGAWRARDGRVAVVAANCSEQPVTARLRFSPAEYGLRDAGPLAEPVTVPGLTVAAWELP